MATSNNPRKFSEKIALHNQKQAEETAAFEEVMKDLSITRAARLQLQKTQYLQLGPNRGQYYGGSLPNVNQIGSSAIDMPFQTPFQNSGLDTSRTTRHHGLVDRVYRDRNRMVSPHRRAIDKQGRQVDSCPYGAVYLSPPPDTSWRRTNSDSALHQSTLTPAQQVLFMGGSQDLQPKRVLLLTVPDSEAIKQEVDEDEDEEQSWDCKKNVSRSKLCKVPGINIFPSPDQEFAASLFPAAHNTGGSLPDLTNIQFPPPLPTPLDPEDAAATSLSTSNSTGNLANTQGDSQQALQLSPSLSPPLPLSQAAINAMSLEQQLCQYAFFTQQPSSQSQSGMVQVNQNQNSSNTPGGQISSQSPMDINTPSSLQYRCGVGSPGHSPTSPVSNQGFFSPRGSPQHNSILGSVFADFYDQQMTSRQTSALSQQLEQFNMMESPIDSNSLYSQASTLNYAQAAMVGLTGSYGNLQDSQQQQLYSSHGNIPNIILTVSGESPPSLSKELSGSLTSDVSFDMDSQFPLDELKMDPLTLDGLHMLNDPDMVLADAATEDAFRLDRL